MPSVLRARNAVMLSFLLNGFCFATWVSRIPEARERLELTNSGLGLLLFGISIGSLSTMPAAGALIHRWGAARVVALGVVLDALGLVVVAVGVVVLESVPLTFAGLLSYGMGAGVWDVAMNVEGAAVERRLAYTIMPRFHAAFSLGTVLAAGLGALVVGVGVPMLVHLPLVAAAALALGIASVARFLPRAAGDDPHEAAGGRSAWAAWLEPRTLLVGLMVMALALTEGTANDWLAVALIDGHGVAHWVGVAGFGLFVAAMTTGRLVGPPFLDRHGRLPVLWATMAAAGSGVLLLVYGDHPALVVAGIVLWGLGASLGFPVGISAASDDPVHAAARVAVVSTIAYTAFLAGPPLLGFLADRVGALHALLIVSLLLVPSALVVPAAREPHPPR